MNIPEELTDNSGLETVLENQESADFQGCSDLGSLIGEEYRPNWLMRKLVSVLEYTMSEYESEPTGDSLLSRVYRCMWNTPVYRYIRNSTPYNYMRKGMKNLMEFWVKGMVGGSTGDIMESAARYLEVRTGIKDDPASYTRDSIIWCGVTGAIGLTLAELGIFALSPAAGIIGFMNLPQQFYNAFMVINPVIFGGDMIRRIIYYKKFKKPTGTWMIELFNSAIKTGRNVTQNYIVPGIRDYVIPFMTRAKEGCVDFYNTRLRPYMTNIKDEFSEIYNTQVRPRITGTPVEATQSLDEKGSLEENLE